MPIRASPKGIRPKQFISETTSNGVSEHLFTLDGIPGALWTPVHATGTRPLLLLAHGGGQHKKADAVMAGARRYVMAHGFTVAAIDAPGHGDRPRVERDELTATWSGIRERMAAGESVGPLVAQNNADLAARAVPDWQATLDALQKLDFVDTDGPVGFFGVSLGTAIGVPLIAAESRISAAVLGLGGSPALAGPDHRPGGIPAPVGRRGGAPGRGPRAVRRLRVWREVAACQPRTARGGARVRAGKFRALLHSAPARNQRCRSGWIGIDLGRGDRSDRRGRGTPASRACEPASQIFALVHCLIDGRPRGPESGEDLGALRLADVPS